MSHRLHSTLNPAGDLYGSYADAKGAAQQMVRNLTQQGFTQVGYAVAPRPDWIHMRNLKTGEKVEIWITVD